MKNGKNTITANEINKFCYCPYQWYYGRIYGSKELQRLSRENKKRLSVKSTKIKDNGSKRLSNFERGRNYHQKDYEAYCLRVKKAKILAVLIAIFIIGVIGLYFYFRVRASV